MALFVASSITLLLSLQSQSSELRALKTRLDDQEQTIAQLTSHVDSAAAAGGKTRTRGRGKSRGGQQAHAQSAHDDDGLLETQRQEIVALNHVVSGCDTLLHITCICSGVVL